VQPEYSFLHQDYQPDQTPTYQLVASVAEHQVTLLVATRLQKVLVLRRYVNRERLALADFLAAVHADYPDLDKEDSFRQVLLHSNRWLLIPEKAFVKGEEAKLLKPVFAVDESHDRFIVDAIAPLTVRNLYATSQPVFELMEQYFPQAQFRHVLSQVIRQAQRVSLKLQTELFAMIELIDYEVVYVVFQDGDLRYGNLYRVANADEGYKLIRTINEILRLPLEELNYSITGQSPFIDELTAKLAELPKPMQSVRGHYVDQPELHEAGIHMDDYSHLLIPY